jgi:hypothetical protein
MMATDDVGCTAKSITTCINFPWSSVSLCQGEEEPREVYHDQAASFIESSSCLGHMAHSHRSSGSRHLPGSSRICALTIILSLVSLVLAVGDIPFLGLPCPCDTMVEDNY